MRVHETVMDWVTGELASGRLRIGDHLPSERALAEELGVSRSSLREALRVLEALGTISAGSGSGPRSGTVVTAVPQQALTLALNLQLATSQVDHRHIFEMRLLLESWTAEHADTAGTDWSDAERLLELMDDPELPVEGFLALDAEFHVLLSHAGGNPLMSTLMDALRTSIADHTLERARALPDWAATAARLRREHREVLAHLRAGETAEAVARLRAHIRGYYEETARV